MSNIVTDIGIKLRGRSQGLYELGWKYCSKCKKFYKVVGKNCIVCGRLLRWSPKGKAGQEFKKRNGVYDKAYSMNDEPVVVANSKEATLAYT